MTMQKMSNKYKLIPELRFPEFVKEGEWEEEELGNCLTYLQPTNYIVSSTAYENTFKIPVLTAGKTFILGYTNEEFGIFSENLPVLIFDDFTTASKYVDFPFKVKSSAMKILLPKNDADIKFVYESMQMLGYEVGVHERHWISIFSKIKIKIPNFKEQQKIASCLSSLDELLTAHTDKLETLKTYKKGLMQNLFPAPPPSEGAGGRLVPKIRFKEFEKDGEWMEKNIGEFAPLQRGFDLPVDNIIIGEFPVVFSNGILKYHNEYKVKAPGVVTGRSGTIGKVTFVEKDFWPHNTSLWVTDFCGNFPMFVYYYFVLIGLEQFAAGGGVPTLNRNDVHRHNILVPISIQEQQKIADTLSSLDELIKEQNNKIEQLKWHKKGLMQGLFPKVKN